MHRATPDSHPPRPLAPGAAEVLASVSDPIVTTVDDFRVTTWNRGAEEMDGWTAAEAVGQAVGSPLGTSWPDDAARFDACSPR